ncbi:MAG: glycosyltransferase [Candidatus Schekmanbacteria bacterium]|nr:glycosyltransferase [Candidatus Schekmanbacteria bacterium]
MQIEINRSNPKLSIIIPSYNSAGTIADCLSSLLNQKTERQLEIIVVDSSQDQTPRIVRDKFPQVRLIHLGQKTDQGSARNIGTKTASGDILFFIDSDCIAPPDWIEQMLAGHSQGYSAVGGPIVNANPESLISYAGYLLEFNDLLPPKSGMEVNHLPSGNVSYRREILEKGGGFPAASGYYLEDLLFNNRLSQTGVKMWYDPKIPMAHVHRSTWRDFIRHQIVYGKSNVHLLRHTRMQGAFIARHPYLCLPLLPLLPIVKFCRVAWRFFSWSPKEFFKHPLIFAILALGLLFWFYGFVRELFNLS